MQLLDALTTWKAERCGILPHIGRYSTERFYADFDKFCERRGIQTPPIEDVRIFCSLEVYHVGYEFHRTNTFRATENLIVEADSAENLDKSLHIS